MQEDPLKKQNTILKDMINSSWNGIAIIAKDGKFVLTNKALSPLFGYTDKELLGLNFIDLIVDNLKEDFKKLLSDNIKNTYKNSMQIGCKRKDSKIVYLDLFIHLMTNDTMFVLNVTDITQRVAEQNLIKKVIIKYDTDIDGNILKASDAFYNITSYSKSELIYKNFKELLHHSTSEKNRESFLSSMEGGVEWQGFLSLCKKDGSVFHVDSISAATKNKYGDIIGHSVVMMDRTSQLNLEKHEIILEEKVSDSEEKLSIMTETMRTVAHEWRQPLNAISLDAQSLLFDLDFDDEVPQEKIHNTLESISKSTQDLSTIIENFQGITELKGSKKKRNIKDIVQEALKICELDEKEFVIEDHEQSASFRTYPKELAMAISSILNNAKEFTSKLDNKNITIYTRQENDKIICTLSNNGGHIAPDLIEQIFTPYFSTKEEKNGVGLSLYTCKVIIELHLKGYITVENIENDTVKFILTFPMGALEE